MLYIVDVHVPGLCASPFGSVLRNDETRLESYLYICPSLVRPPMSFVLQIDIMVGARVLTDSTRARFVQGIGAKEIHKEIYCKSKWSPL